MKSKQVENWLKIAKYDLRAAKSAFKENLYLKVVENSHSAIEKLLKGLIQSSNKQPPKIHNLMILASETILNELKEETKKTLDELNDAYMLTRYPDDFDAVELDLSKDKVQIILKRVERIFKWLEKKIN